MTKKMASKDGLVFQQVYGRLVKEMERLVPLQALYGEQGQRDSRRIRNLEMVSLALLRLRDDDLWHPHDMDFDDRYHHEISAFGKWLKANDIHCVSWRDTLNEDNEDNGTYARHKLHDVVPTFIFADFLMSTHCWCGKCDEYDQMSEAPGNTSEVTDDE